MTEKQKTKIDFGVFAPSQNMSWPNLVSVIRLLIIPLILWLYFSERIWLAVIMVAVSALTDALDGYIARHYDQITPLGKVLDPLADKLTQVALAVCLVNEFPVLMPLIVVLLIKEILMLSWGLQLLRAGQPPFCALWWGKLSTAGFFIGCIIIMLFSGPLGVLGRGIITFLIIFLMLNSMLRYWHVFRKKTKNAGQER